MIIHVLLLSACTDSPGPADHGEPRGDESDSDTDMDTDSDSDSDSDTDSDTDTDTNTKIPQTWSWGDVVTVEDAQASYVRENAGEWAGGCLTAVGDMTGDGIGDLAIGAPWNDDGALDGGKVYVLAGRAGGWSTELSLADLPSVVGTHAGMELCRTYAAGDLNGDGRQDLGITKGFQNVAPEGGEYLMFGADGLWSPGVPCETADVVVHVDPARGSDLALFATDQVLGDVDGDAHDDWLYGLDGGIPSVHVVSGGSLSGLVEAPDTLDAFVLRSTDDAPFSSIGAVGDYDGDARADLLTSSPDGVWRLVPGSSAPAKGETPFSLATAWFLSAKGATIRVVPLGDFDGDGFADLAVVGDADGEDGIHLFFGGPGVEGAASPDSSPVVIAPGWSPWDVMDAGDVNGDGLHDLVFHLDDEAEDEGDLGIVFGRAKWPNAIEAEDLDVRIAREPGDAQGWIRTTARGDIDGDGLSDLVLVSMNEEVDGLEYAGAIRIYRGRTTWPANVDRDDSDLTLVGSRLWQGLGTALAVVDLNGDGRDDLVTSSPYHPGPLDGTVFVLFGEPAP